MHIYISIVYLVVDVNVYMRSYYMDYLVRPNVSPWVPNFAPLGLSFDRGEGKKLNQPSCKAPKKSCRVENKVWNNDDDCNGLNINTKDDFQIYYLICQEVTLFVSHTLSHSVIPAAFFLFVSIIFWNMPCCLDFL